jgi:hypothetical protein
VSTIKEALAAAKIARLAADDARIAANEAQFRSDLEWVRTLSAKIMVAGLWAVKARADANAARVMSDELQAALAEKART